VKYRTTEVCVALARIQGAVTATVIALCDDEQTFAQGVVSISEETKVLLLELNRIHFNEKEAK